ncbi:MAG: LytTR family transcriptional regulator DNA-binding domain-containing protein [Emticicia sp.]|uniref:LytTR family transcriptional regulator DNA-binding domain-containing protein n=1 Tax=Emticicia sp. TaxID=1930953 RepID=UPI003BA5D364
MKNRPSRKHETLLKDASKQIIRLQADTNYTIFYMQSGQTQVMSYSLKNYQDALTFPFIRVNKSCIINLHFFRNIDATSKKILLKDGSEFQISRRRFEEVCRNISNF